MFPCPRPTNPKNHERDYNRPQPVRIRLLMEDEEKKKAEKSSTKKKILPERLGPLSSRKTSTREQENELYTCVKPKSRISRASRNLDFNNITAGSVNNKADDVSQLDKPTNTEQTSTKVCRPKMRTSFLAAPNSIRNKHLQGCIRRAINNSERDALKENVPLNNKSAVPIPSSKSIASLNTNHTSSEMMCIDRNEFMHLKCELENFISTTEQNLIKKKVKPQSIRFMECLTCPRPTNPKNHERDYNRPQPVRIRLLMEDEEKKKAEKSSTKKKILPERLGPLSSRKTSTREQENELYTCVKPKSRISRASRNLDFNNITAGSVNNKADDVSQLDKPTNTEQTSAKVCRPKMRTSFLAAPNSIRNKHLQGCIRRAINNSERDALKENVPLNNKSAVPIPSSKSIASLNTNHTSSEMMCIDRNEFMHLKCELENFISTTEQNLIKVKSILTKLSMPQISISQSNISKEGKINTEVNSADEIQVESCESKQSTEENSKFTGSCTDDVENQFDIERAKPVKKLPSLQNTPVIINDKQKHSMKEYMSLKSSMNILQTPDRKFWHQKNNIDERTINNKFKISTKLLAELRKLYSEEFD